MAAPAAPAPGLAAPETLCTVTDPRLTELSGLVVDGDAIWAVPDGGRRVLVYRIDPATCAITATRSADLDPYDVEDLALGPDGALWVADTGDNDRVRDTVAVVVLPRQGAPVLHRLTYPDGPHDAEALLVDGRGRPVIVTKEGDFGSGVYRPDAPPTGPGPTPLRRVSGMSLPASDGQSGPLGGIGSRLVTGAAATSDGQVVALRSYTDAWLYRVPPDGDVAAALAGPATRVPLPGEPQGEAIAFGRDGTLYSGSEARNGHKGELRAVRGAAALAATPTATAAPPPSAAAPATPDWWPAAIGGGVAVGLLALLTGAMALRRRRH